MRQAVFVKHNEKKWHNYESVIDKIDQADADEIAKIYVHLTEDHAFAQANYPKSKVSTYLSQLTLKVHHYIYRHKPEAPNRFLTFWVEELPSILYNNRRFMLYSFIIMMIGVLIGAISTIYDDGFVRLILGDSYVNMTIENIKKGKPMDVYDSMNMGTMFLIITSNNIKVALMAFAWGILFSVGTGYILFSNGVMLGAFHAMFYQHGIFDSTLLTIWIHGTLEISAIVFAGAAGLTMGNAFLYPKSYPRGYMLKRGAKDGVKMVLSLIPFFVVAGFLESVVTRQVHWPLFVKLIIIGISTAIVIFYLFILPNLHKINEYRKS